MAEQAAGCCNAQFGERAAIITKRVDEFLNSVHELPGAFFVHWCLYLVYGIVAVALSTCFTVFVCTSQWASPSQLRLPFACVMSAFVFFFVYVIFRTLCGYMMRD